MTKERYDPWYGGLIKEVAPLIDFEFHKAIVSNENYQEILDEVKACEFIAYDTETTSLDFTEAKLVTIQISFNHKNYIVIVNHSFRELHKDKMPRDDQIYKLTKAMLEVPNVFVWNNFYDQRVLLHNIKKLKREDFSNMIDGFDLLFMLDTNVDYSELGLKKAMTKFLGWTTESYDETVEGFNEPPIKNLCVYGAKDAYGTFMLGMKLYKIFTKEFDFLLKLHRKFEIVLFRMEDQEQVIDIEKLDKLRISIEGNVENIKNTFYEKYGVINLNSPAQKADKLKELGYDTKVYTKTGMSVKSALLEALKCEPAELMMKYTKYVKILSSYIKPSIEYLKEGNTPHFHYLDSRVSTMRLASSSYKVKKRVSKIVKGVEKVSNKKMNVNHFLPLNLQSMPKAKEVKRRMDFHLERLDDKIDSETWYKNNPVIQWNDEGKYLVETGDTEGNFRSIFSTLYPAVIVRADYSGQEIVLSANYSKEPVWLEALKNGEDIHLSTAQAIWKGREIDGNLRKQAKIANFMLLYGGSAKSLAVAMGISEDEAYKLVNMYENALKTLYKWKREVIIEGKTTGSVKNDFGMVRRVYPYYSSNNKAMRNYADRACVNTKIQGCVQGHVRVLTSGGYIKIKDLYNNGGAEKLLVHTGKLFSRFFVLNRGVCRLGTLELDDGSVLDCDIRHEIFVWENSKSVIRRVMELKKGDLVIKKKPEDVKFLHSNKSFKNLKQSKEKYRMLGLQYFKYDLKEKEDALEIPEEVWRASSDERTSFIKGVLDGLIFSRQKKVKFASYKRALQVKRLYECSFEGSFDVEKVDNEANVSINGNRKRFIPFKSFTPLDKEEETYTLTVMDTEHSFVSDGVISKNTAGIMIRLALCRIYDMMYKEDSKYYGDAYFINTVHDEIVTAVKPHRLNSFVLDLESEMQKVNLPHWEVKVKAGLEIGLDYGSMIPIKVSGGVIEIDEC